MGFGRETHPEMWHMAEEVRPWKVGAEDKVTELNCALDEISLPFFGPFSWTGTPDGPSVYEVDGVRKAGIYLWTVPLPDGHLIYYVGETGRSFDVRLRQHYEELAAARYHVYSAVEFARGEKLCVWPGHWDATDRQSDEECQANCARLSEQIQEMMLAVRFFLAPTTCDKRIRRRIEAAIAQGLYATPGIVGTFQDQGIHYWPRMSHEEPIKCVASSPVPLLGLPERFLA
jgi:hypothetical protein